MDSIQTYNPLYRPLLDGREFNGLIPKSQCISTRLASGNTHVTVSHMTDWVNKHYKQTDNLLPKLKRNTLQDTVNRIYWFLYNHIQYRADGREQLLRSPACAWHQRYDGVDCKSYSIFASCILKNLGIAHYIREVRQPYANPDQFTHVYIIVPKKGKNKTPGNYYVIDATKHDQSEVDFIEAKDIFMSGLPHTGLNGVATDTVRVPEKTMQGFENYLSFLNEVGVSQELTNAIRKEVMFYINIGVNPAFHINDKGVIVQKKLFPYTPNTGLNAAIKRLKSAKAIANRNAGLGGTDGSNQSTTDQTEGEELEEVTQVVLESNWFKDTFGAIFANGFNFSCWGSSYSPSKAKKHVEVDMPFIVKWSGLLDNINSNTMSRFLELCALYRVDSINGQKSKFAKCTREGHKIRQQSVDALEKEILDQIRENYVLTPTLRKQGKLRIESGLPGYGAGQPYYWNNPYDYQGYVVKIKENTSSGGGVVITDGGSGTGGNNPDISSPFNPTNPVNPNTPQPSGSIISKNAGIAIGAVAVLGLVFSKQIKTAFTKNKK